MNTLIVLLIRHGQTVANVKGLIQGQGDTPLTDIGKKSTIIKSNKLRFFDISAVYCSDLGRAVRTYEILHETQQSLPEANFNSELREIDFGDLTFGRKDELIEAIFHHRACPEQRYPHGEGGNDLAARIQKFYDDLFNRHMGQTLLVVSHYGVIESSVRLYTDYPAEQPVILKEEDVLELKFDGSRRATLSIF